jgi:hypothetical protein
VPRAADVEILRRMRASIGVRGALEVVLYPLLTPLYAAAAWLGSLWRARVLLDGQWHRYRGFHPGNALTSFFYATQWLNLSRFGVRGRSPLVGLGNYPLGRWFHLSLLSSCLYAQAGAVCTLTGTLAWVLLHLVWLDAATTWWVLAVTATLLFSSTGFAMAFTRQNYNILGWMWLPLALYAVARGQWVLAAFAFLAASLASITVVFAALPLMLALAMQAGSIAPVLVLVPALLKLALHLEPVLGGGGGAWATIRNMAKMIGVSSSGVRYARESMRLRPLSAYFIVLYAASVALLWADHRVPVLPLAALGLFIVNQLFVRFADEQSVIVMFVSAVAAQLLGAPPSLLGWIAFSIAANPLPVFLGLCAYEQDRSLVRVRTRAPFDHAALLAACERFLEAIPAGATALFAFEDPEGVYENIFDGYRTVLELPRYVAASRGVRLIPDWHAIAETNYPGAPAWWGRSPDCVLANAKSLGASHAVVYTDSGVGLDGSWALAGFVEKASFDWGTWGAVLGDEALWRSPRPPRWWLLAVPAAHAAEEGQK